MMSMSTDPKPLDPVLLRSFLKVCETLSFTEAARQLGLRQSSVSQHVARLEKRVGRKLLARDTHEVRPTPDGDAIQPFARQVLEAGSRIEHYLKGSTLRGGCGLASRRISPSRRCRRSWRSSPCSITPSIWS